ncbi:MAG: DUF342 domain-containing protein, partial [Gammaproteobacteria bacterium]|nr:DUF342 domain-containing protein [Gammaproteobacteria bacterium]
MDNANNDITLSPTRFGLEFNLLGDGTTLNASYTPVPNLASLEYAMLTKMLQQLGYSHLPLMHDQLMELCKKQNSSKEFFSIAISGDRDGDIEVTQTKDGMNALVFIRHATGEGQLLTADSIKGKLAAANVAAGIKQDVIEQIVQDQGRSILEEVVIAQGKVPVDGKDTEFVNLVSDAAIRKPTVLDHEVVDYREFGGVTTVAPGDQILKKLPPTPGEDGFRVSGDIVPARSGKEREFKLNKSVAPDQNDPDILVALIGGQPVITEKGAFVEELINLNNVDLSSGNIDFDGSVILAGDVQNGM